MFSRSIALCASAMALGALATCLAALASPLTIDQATELSAQRSESARAARATVTSSSESAYSADQLPDPVVSVGLDNLPIDGPDRYSTTRDFMTQRRIGISQEWLSPVKRQTRRAAADAGTAREAVQVDAAIAEARLGAALAFIDALYLGQAVRLAELTVHHDQDELDAARARLASATGSSSDLLGLQLSQGMAEDDLIEARQQFDAALVALKRWIGVTPDELADTDKFSVPSEENYVTRMPTVVVLNREIELANRQVDVAKSERTSNWTWEVSYSQRLAYSDMVSVGVSIPWQIAPMQRQDRGIAAKLALVGKVEADLQEAVRAATGEYQALTSDIRRLEERIQKYQDAVMSAASQRTALALAAFRSNQGPISTLFDARHAQLEVQRKLLLLRRDLAKTRALLAYKPLQPGGQL